MYFEIRWIPLWIEVPFNYSLVKRCSTLFPKLNWWSPNSEQLSWLLRNVVQLSLKKGAGRYKNLVGPKTQIYEIVGIFPSKTKGGVRKFCQNLGGDKSPCPHRFLRPCWIYARCGGPGQGTLVRFANADHAWKDGLNKTWISISKIQLSIILNSGMNSQN